MNFKKSGALWLWDDKPITDNEYVCFRQDIVLTSAEKAFFFLSCDTNYMLWINGQFVNFGQYLALPENKFYDKLDVTEYVTEGKNTVCVLVYYQGKQASSCYKTGTPALICFMEADGKIYNCNDMYTKHASGFLEGDLERISFQLGPTFEFDARKNEDWTNPAFATDNSWEKAVIQPFGTHLTEKLNLRPVKKLDFSQKSDFRLINKGSFEYREPEKNTAERMQSAFSCMSGLCTTKWNEAFTVDKDNTSVIIDLGCETAGYFELDMDCEDELQIDVAYGEHLADMRVRSFIVSRHFAFTYYSKKGNNSFVNFTRRLAGRYIQLNLTGVKGKNTVNYAGFRKAVYPVKRLPDLDIKDKLHKKIYETCIKTLAECMHEHYEDCPWREQAMYAFDSRNQMLAGYTVFENSKFVKACLELMDTSLEDDGFQMLCVPKNGVLKIPGFSLMWIVAVCEYIEHTGKVNDMKKLLCRAEKMFAAYSGNRRDDGLLMLPDGEQYWYFYDWADGLGGTIKTGANANAVVQSTDALYNLLVLYALKKYIDTAHCIGIDASLQERMYKSLRTVVNKVFFNKEKGLYKTFEDSEHYCEMAQALAILSDTARNKKALRKSLRDGGLIRTTLSTMILKYEALIEDPDYAKFVLDDIAETWGDMLYKGATTFYETQKGYEDFNNAGSLCHGWSAIPLVIYKKLNV